MSDRLRYQGLDFLRGIAIIGVLLRHLETETWIAGPGGYGVDLFFVLSGFLVSGLLFSEYIRNGKINAGRFLIRRGFKIYPSFYFFILSTITLFAVLYDSYFSKNAILSEVFFLQSYIHPMWSHTWSLAVEEHFYIFLVIIIYFFAKFNLLQGKGMITLFTLIILTTMTLRYFYVQYTYSINQEAFFYTHLRMDGLFTGALLGYFWHFRKNALEKFYNSKKLIVWVIPILILPALILKTNHPFMLTFGFNLFHLACAFSILFLLKNGDEEKPEKKNIFSKLKSAVSFIGVYSYAIYLWHLPVQNILLRNIPNMVIESVVYITLSLAVGIGMSMLIEKPMLKLRDKYFPGK